ncbi:hypothetical protein JL722_636 [Aureococcus anophagefferens]|nr:hypothetical protein JL722_636 [Aureococcus anophagefferens]
MAAWEPPINPFTGSPETPNARLPPSLRPRMGKGRAYVLLAVDAHGEWRGTGAACDTPAAAERAWLAQRSRGCALLRLGASGWEDHGVVRARYYATAAAAEAAWRWLPLHFASALFVRGGGGWGAAARTYGTAAAVAVVEAAARLPAPLAECWDAPPDAAHTHAGAGEILDAGAAGAPATLRRTLSGAPPREALVFVTCPVGVRAGAVCFVTPGRRSAAACRARPPGTASSPRRDDDGAAPGA